MRLPPTTTTRAAANGIGAAPILRRLTSRHRRSGDSAGTTSHVGILPNIWSLRHALARAIKGGFFDASRNTDDLMGHWFDAARLSVFDACGCAMSHACDLTGPPQLHGRHARLGPKHHPEKRHESCLGRDGAIAPPAP